MNPPNVIPDSEPVPGSPSRNHGPHGRWALDNDERLQTGKYSKRVARALLPEQVAVLRELEAHEAALVADLGGLANLSTFERDLVRRYQELANLADFNAPRMFSQRLATRREATSVFLATLDKQLKVVSLLGHRRRQRGVAEMSAREYGVLVAEEES